MGRLWVAIGYGPPVTWNVLSYDVRGRVSTETFNFRNLDTSLSNASIAYAYDREGKVKAVRDPRGRWIEYRRNYLGQIDASLGDPRFGTTACGRSRYRTSTTTLRDE